MRYKYKIREARMSTCEPRYRASKTMNNNVLPFVTLLASVLPGILACGGYKFEITKMESCDSNSVFQVQPGFEVNLVEKDGKCMAVPNGCVTVTQKCDSATMTYDLMRGLAPIKGTRDCCSDMENMSSETKAIVAMFGLPDHCPVEAGTLCSKDGKGVDITAYTSYFSMLSGPTTGTIKFDHGNAKSCIKVGCRMTKPFLMG